MTHYWFFFDLHVIVFTRSSRVWMKTWASCLKFPKNRLARKKKEKVNRSLKWCVYNATRYLYLSSFPTISHFKAASLKCFKCSWTNINKRTLNSYPPLWKVLLEFRYVYLNKPFGFHFIPPREVVHRNTYLGAFNSIFSAATTRALDPWKFFKAFNWISSVVIPKQHKTFAMK